MWLPEHTAAATEAADVLDEEERRRAAAFRFPLERERFVTAHVGLRLFLGAHLGTDPREVVFVRQRCGAPGCGRPHGRPAVAGRPDVHFSLSHAADTALCALSGSPVGADIESEALVRDGLERTARRLHPEEQRALAALPAAVRPSATCSCLVRKEAYLKGIGTGLAGGLGTHHVGLGERFAPTAAAPGPSGWVLRDVPAPEGYQAAVAVRRDGGGRVSAADGHP
ncbi:4-phosphopantetheinyl transferase [Streptomyces armeniacus]|uniref:4-phosphopantetheinyl transferase n=1 Tax=Streptomyces armeniacus TaxID=83291 RepID=A0A345Y1L4_9ACTN|nr:4-phosphopantetheinyl transferase [Streptomyces armeniacus]